MSLSFGFKLCDNAVWASINGEVDMEIAPAWREALDRQLAQTMARNLVFDFTGVSFIDSSGLGVVLGRYKRVASRGGQVKIVGADSQVYRILTLSGLGGLMEIEPPGDVVLGGGVL